MFKKILLTGFVSFIMLSSVQAIDIPGTLYYGEGCMHCGQVESFMEKNDLQIEKKEIYKNPSNANEFNERCDEFGISLSKRGVPMLIDEGVCYVGTDEILEHITPEKENNKKPAHINVQDTQGKKLTLGILVSAALVDAINPCAFAVLILLISSLIISGNKRRALFSGLSFSIAIFISYFLMGLGLYSIIASFETSLLFMKLVAIMAIILGLLNIKDYRRYGKGRLMEVPLSRRPKMKKIIKGATSPVGAFIVGCIVSLFLLPCTSGPYIVILGMLGHQETYNEAVRLILFYNLIFILPMIAITLASYRGLNLAKTENLRKRHLPTLHLIAGILLLLIGAGLLITL